MDGGGIVTNYSCEILNKHLHLILMQKLMFDQDFGQISFDLFVSHIIRLHVEVRNISSHSGPIFVRLCLCFHSHAYNTQTHNQITNIRSRRYPSHTLELFPFSRKYMLETGNAKIDQDKTIAALNLNSILLSRLVNPVSVGEAIHLGTKPPKHYSNV